MLNYQTTYNNYPPHAISDPQGKPLLSWRVAILPFIEQNELYKGFISMSLGTARTTSR